METAAQKRDPYFHPELLHDRATCECVRCKGFQPGNQINAGRARLDLTKHGAGASPLVLAPEAERIAEMIRPLMPTPHPAFEGELQSYCICMARIQRAQDALEREEREKEAFEQRKRAGLLEEGEEYEPSFAVPYLEENLRRWLNQAGKSAGRLGFTPESAVKILKDASEGMLAQQRGMFTEAEAKKASTSQLERAREILMEEDDIVEHA